MKKIIEIFKHPITFWKIAKHAKQSTEINYPAKKGLLTHYRNWIIWLWGTWS